MQRTYSHSDKTPWKRLRELLSADKPLITQLYLYAIFTGIISLSLPLGIQSVIHYIQMGQVTSSWITLIILVVGGVVLTGVLQIMQLRITEILQQRIYVYYGFDFAYRFPRMDSQSLEGEKPQELANRFFDVIILQKSLSDILLSLVSSLVLVIFCLLVLSFYHPFFILFSLSIVTLITLVFRPVVRRGIRTSLVESKHKYKTAYWIQEIARADWSFRIASRSNYTLDRLDEHTQNYLQSRESHFKVLWLQYIWMIAVKSISVAVLLALGGYLVISQQMNLGQFVAAEILILLMLGAVEKIIQLFEKFYDALTSLEKLGQVQDFPMVFEQAANAFSDEQLFPVRLSVVDGKEASVALEVLQGQHRIITGLNDWQSGIILRSLIDTSISDRFQPSWNYSRPESQTLADGFEHIGWFTPQGYLFDGTITENVLLGRLLPETAKLTRAIEVVGLSKRILELPHGTSTQVEKQVFDARETQRLLMARAVVHEPSLLIASFIGSALTPAEQEDLLRKISEQYPHTTIVCALDSVPEALNWKSISLKNYF